MIHYKDGKFVDSYMFLEVLPEHSSGSTLPQVQKLPAGNYLCYQELREVHSDPLSIYPEKLMDTGDVTVIISSMSPDTYKFDKVILEFHAI